MANIEDAPRKRVEQIRDDAREERRKLPWAMDRPERNRESQAEAELRARGKTV